MTGETLTLRRPDDWHVHLRDGAMLAAVLPFTAKAFARAIVMPNLNPPVTGIAAARAYRRRIMEALPKNTDFTPLMTCYLTDRTDPDQIARGFEQGVFAAAKLYPAPAPPNATKGVTVIAPKANAFGREARFNDGVLAPLMKLLPGLKVVFEHVTTSDAVDFVNTAGSNLAATITAHHLVINRNALFAGGLRPHMYCLPVAKSERRRLALRRAAISGSPKFFLGTDTAPHAIADKEKDCGCAGIFSAPVALETYARVFEEENALARLETFASLSGPRFYGLPPNETRITLKRARWKVPEQIRVGKAAVNPFLAGETLGWKRVP